MRNYILLLLLTLLTLGRAAAQTSEKDGRYDIKNDTIQITSNDFPLLLFMGEISSTMLLSKEEYLLQVTGNTLRIRPNTKNPSEYSTMLVKEGSKSASRNHVFVINYVKELTRPELVHDYSTRDLIKKRVAALELARKGGGEAKESGKSGKKGKKGGNESAKNSKGGDEGSDEPVAAAKQIAPKVTGAAGKGGEAVKSGAAAAKGGTAAVRNGATAANTARNNAKGSDRNDAGDNDGDNSNTQRDDDNDRGGRSNTPDNGGGTASAPTITRDKGRKRVITDENSIRSIPRETLEGLVNAKIKRFYSTCEKLGAREDIPTTMRKGMALFNNNEEVLVGRSVNGTAKPPVAIRKYLTGLTKFSYSKVEITAKEINYVGNIHKGPDGKYYGTAVVLQDFKGFNDDVIAYADMTNKTIQYEVEVYEVEDGDKVLTKFNVYLGNISVQSVQ